MTTIRQLIQSSPAKANELFSKLVDTSETAVKTRDRLFSELKVELDLQAELEEQHLFPVLRKHKETKGLVAEALNDNRQTRKLLAELDRIPKDTEAFGDKVAELRKSFQQHVRDDKKEFLPAVVKALTDEEASTVVEKIEDEKDQIEAARRADAEERRAEARRERERAEAVQKVAEAAGQGAKIVKTGIEMAQQGAKVARKAAMAGADDAGETDKVAIGQSMMTVLSEQARHAMEATIAVGRSRTLAEVTRAQSDFIGGSVQRMGQLNESYLAFIRGGMASTAFRS